MCEERLDRPRSLRCEMWGLALGALLGSASHAHATEQFDIGTVLHEVNKILKTNVQKVPTVELVPSLPGGDWGGYAGGHIQISNEALGECKELVLWHETSHHVAIEAGLLRHLPNDGRALKTELERIASHVELAYDKQWLPGCLNKAH